MARVRAGQLRHRVTVQESTETVDAVGQPIPAWDEYAMRQAEIKHLTGRELIASQQIWPEVDTDIRMRGDTQTRLITPKMRVVFGAKVFNIKAVLDTEEIGFEMLLKCRKEGQ